MQDCNPINTPFARGENLSKEMGPKTLKEKRKMSNIPYSNAIRSLMFATMCTRPDICYAIGMVSLYQENLGMMHWKAINRILRSCMVEKIFAKLGNSQGYFWANNSL
ncbi:hypothetical protein AAG906_011226 [Vitis piasezkii]